MEAADVPQYNWTISATGEEITVMADRWTFFGFWDRFSLFVQRKPLKVNMWHSSTCHAHANIRWESANQVQDPEIPT